MGSDIPTDVTMTDMSETTREENIGDMDMDFGDVQKESIDKGTEPTSLEVPEYSSSLIKHDDVEPMIYHKKTKKDVNLNIIAQDYVCIPRDITVIKSIMCAPKNTKFVDIEDALLSNDNLECLTRADMFLHDGVINAYIYCMLAHDHLRDRAGGKLLGLEKRLKLGEQSPEFNRDHKWPDLNVTTWKVIEQFEEAIRTDGVSCGLFMLNYMEYWTADALSDDFTQEDMKQFRSKLAVILLDSELNKLKGCPLYCQSDDEAVLPNSDLEILDNPPDGCKDKRPTPIPIMPTDQCDLLVGLCNYIMSIDDTECLEKEWVRISTPHPMCLSLKKLQGILNMEQVHDATVNTRSKVLREGNYSDVGNIV